jgi:NADH-quinone oxidoreductase subunit M
MNQVGFPLLSIVVFMPLAGALVTLLLPALAGRPGGRRRMAVKAWGLAVAVADLALACVLWGFFNYGRAGLQFEDQAAWIQPLGISSGSCS